jgi:hypothetical protein
MHKVACYLVADVNTPCRHVEYTLPDSGAAYAKGDLPGEG